VPVWSIGGHPWEGDGGGRGPTPMEREITPLRFGCIPDRGDITINRVALPQIDDIAGTAVQNSPALPDLVETNAGRLAQACSMALERLQTAAGPIRKGPAAQPLGDLGKRLETARARPDGFPVKERRPEIF